MKRTRILLAGIVVGVVSATAVASAHGGGPTAQAGRAAKVQLRNTSLGKVLVDTAGFTLYTFTRDSRDKDSCITIRGCFGVWPALGTSGNPTPGPGVKASLLSTITLPGGARQVTYAGHPLYLYAPASQAAETSYVGAMQFGGSWDAVNAAGSAVR